MNTSRKGRRPKTAGTSSREPLPEAVVLSTEAQAELEHALGALPESQRIAVVLSDVEGWTYREIAAACSVSNGTVKSRSFRGRKALRDQIARAGLLGGTSGARLGCCEASS